REHARKRRTGIQDDDYRGGDRDESREAKRSREREPCDERAAEDVWAPDHGHGGTTSPFSCASLPAPIPGTPSSSSSERNAPCACRYSTIFSAVDGPIPGSASSCSAVAEFRSTGAVGDGVPPAAAAAPAAPR